MTALTWTGRGTLVWSRARPLSPGPGTVSAFRRRTGAARTWWTAWARCRVAKARGCLATSSRCRSTRRTGCGRGTACSGNSRWASRAGDGVVGVQHTGSRQRCRRPHRRRPRWPRPPRTASRPPACRFRPSQCHRVWPPPPPWERSTAAGPRPATRSSRRSALHPSPTGRPFRPNGSSGSSGAAFVSSSSSR